GLAGAHRESDGLIERSGDVAKRLVARLFIDIQVDERGIPAARDKHASFELYRLHQREDRRAGSLLRCKPCHRIGRERHDVAACDSDGLRSQANVDVIPSAKLRRTPLGMRIAEVELARRATAYA